VRELDPYSGDRHPIERFAGETEFAYPTREQQREATTGYARGSNRVSDQTGFSSMPSRLGP